MVTWWPSPSRPPCPVAASPMAVGSAVADWESEGKTVVVVSRDDRLVGALAVTDSLRSTAAPAVRRAPGARLALRAGERGPRVLRPCRRPVHRDHGRRGRCPTGGQGGGRPPAPGRREVGGHGGGRGERWTGAGHRRSRHRHRIGHRRGHRSGRDGGRPRRPHGGPRRHRIGPANPSHHPRQPGVGVLLQRRRHPRGRPRLPRPAHRRRGHGRLLGLRRLEQLAAPPRRLGVRRRAGRRHRKRPNGPWPGRVAKSRQRKGGWSGSSQESAEPER